MQYGDEASNKYLTWSKEIRQCLAYIEASIDFSDEEIPRDLLEGIKKISKKVKEEIDFYIKTEKQNEIIKEGIKIAIIGSQILENQVLSITYQRKIFQLFHQNLAQLQMYLGPKEHMMAFM